MGPRPNARLCVHTQKNIFYRHKRIACVYTGCISQKTFTCAYTKDSLVYTQQVLFCIHKRISCVYMRESLVYARAHLLCMRKRISCAYARESLVYTQRISCARTIECLLLWMHKKFYVYTRESLVYTKDILMHVHKSFPWYTQEHLLCIYKIDDRASDS